MQSIYRIQLLLLSIVTLWLSACDINVNPAREVSQYESLGTEELGWLSVSPVANINYQGEYNAGISDENGYFVYRENETLQFFIGDSYIGEATGASIITPLELTGSSSTSDSSAINLTRLLMSLDDDLDASNGIAIMDSARQLNSVIDLSDETALDKLVSQLDPTRTLIAAATAQALLEQTILDIQTSHLGTYQGTWLTSADPNNSCDYNGDLSLQLSIDNAAAFSLTGTLSHAAGDDQISGNLDSHSRFSATIDSLAVNLSGTLANGIASGNWNSIDGGCQGVFEATIKTTQFKNDASIISSAFQQYNISELTGNEVVYLGAAEPNQTIARTFEFINDTDEDYTVNEGTKRGLLSNGFFFSYDTCTTLSPGEACLVILTFTYQIFGQDESIEEGEKTSTLQVIPNSTDQPTLDFLLSATVRVDAGISELFVTPDLIGFSESTAGVTSEPQRLFIYNRGKRQLYILPVAINEPAFNLIDTGNESCNNRLLKSYQHCLLEVSFTAPANAQDRFTNGVLVVRSDDPAVTTAGITLEGYTGADINCFIATAAYGSYLDPHVESLRQFRDDYLKTNIIPGGQRLLEFYYEYSPEIAHYIRQRDTLRALVRGILTPIVFMIEQPLLFFILTIFLFSAGIIYRKKSRLA